MMHLTPEERDMLIRLDTKFDALSKQWTEFKIHERLVVLETRNWRVEGGILLLIFLVGAGRLIDLIYTILHMSK
jgi:hypothetical protein